MALNIYCPGCGSFLPEGQVEGMKVVYYCPRCNGRLIVEVRLLFRSQQGSDTLLRSAEKVMLRTLAEGST